MARARAMMLLARAAARCSTKLPNHATYRAIHVSHTADATAVCRSSFVKTAAVAERSFTAPYLFSSEKEDLSQGGGSTLVEWESEDEGSEPKIGDGSNGGGVVLGDVQWGEKVLYEAQEILAKNFGKDLELFAFKITPTGYIYLRLDKIVNKYGCPDAEEIRSFSTLYKEKLDEMVESGEVPLDLALQVSSPGTERLLKVPEDLARFKDMPMKVQYLEEDLSSNQHQQKDGIFLLELVDTETRNCVWKLANVRENRDAAGKGRPLSRKQKDWRLQTPFKSMRKVMLHLETNH